MGSGRNGNEVVAGAASEAVIRWLHHRYAPVELPLAGRVSFRLVILCYVTSYRLQYEISFSLTFLFSYFGLHRHRYCVNFCIHSRRAVTAFSNLAAPVLLSCSPRGMPRGPYVLLMFLFIYFLYF